MFLLLARCCSEVYNTIWLKQARWPPHHAASHRSMLTDYLKCSRVENTVIDLFYRWKQTQIRLPATVAYDVPTITQTISNFWTTGPIKSRLCQKTLRGGAGWGRSQIFHMTYLWGNIEFPLCRTIAVIWSLFSGTIALLWWQIFNTFGQEGDYLKRAIQSAILHVFCVFIFHLLAKSFVFCVLRYPPICKFEIC